MICNCIYNYNYHGIRFYFIYLLFYYYLFIIIIIIMVFRFLYHVRFSLLHRTHDFIYNFALQFILPKAGM